MDGRIAARHFDHQRENSFKHGVGDLSFRGTELEVAPVSRHVDHRARVHGIGAAIGLVGERGDRDRRARDLGMFIDFNDLYCSFERSAKPDRLSRLRHASDGAVDLHAFHALRLDGEPIAGGDARAQAHFVFLRRRALCRHRRHRGRDTHRMKYSHGVHSFLVARTGRHASTEHVGP